MRFCPQEHQRRRLRQTRTVLGREFLDRVSPIRLIEQLQASFALGMGVPQGTGDYGSRSLQYANGGKPVSVTRRAASPSIHNPVPLSCMTQERQNCHPLLCILLNLRSSADSIPSALTTLPEGLHSQSFRIKRD
jgi:hypothetical protein